VSERTHTGGLGPDPLAAGSGPAPEFTILGAETVRHAAAPSLAFAIHVTEPTGRDVYTIALRAQIMIEPARRSYDDDTRAMLVELFGPPERWGSTTTSFVWLETDVLVPAFSGSTTFRVPIACTYDMELAAVKYFYSVSDGEVPLQFNFTGSIFHRGAGGALQIAKIPWDTAADFRMPVVVWKEMVAHYYPHRGYAPLHSDTLDALMRRRAERGLPSLDATVAELLEEEG
jgi:hypothetical protein